MEETDRSGPALQLRKGDIVGERYHIDKRLGTGGTGTVYLAFDSFLEDQPIAIKMLHPHLNREEKHTKRFVREVLLTRQVTHQNVVRTFDVATQDENLFYTMEYVSGNSLTKLLRRGVLPINDGVGIIVEICKGLAAIHDAGIIHRDLKPGNVILTDSNEVKISDFGIARHEEHSVTTSSEVVGSCHYIAPEVWRGEVNAPTIDIYSLGVLAYEMFTGVRMFAGDTIHELMYKHCQTAPTAPNLINEEIPPWLNDIILAMVEKNPSLRPQSARQIGLTIEDEHRADCEQYTQRITVSPEQLAAIREEEITDPHQMIPESEIPADMLKANETLLQTAGEDLLKSWTTKQEKLSAIECLESIGSEDSIQYLQKAVERYHPDESDLTPQRNWPQAGEVAARAARALGQIKQPIAENYLLNLINNKSNPASLRECGLYGVAASNSDNVLLTLRRTFLDEHGPIRQSVLLAIQESLRPLGKSKKKSVVQLTLTLVEFTTERHDSKSESVKELLGLSRTIIRHHLTTPIEEQLVSIVTSSNDLPKCLEALSLLRGSGNPRAQRALAELLRDEVLPEEFSLAIGQVLKDSQNALVRKVAQEIIEHNNLVQNLINSFSMSKNRKVRGRRLAAKVILGQDLSEEDAS